MYSPKKGGIDRLYLKDVRRRYLKDDQLDADEHPDKYYFMPGQFFILPFSQIINLHITYYEVAVSETTTEENLEAM